MIEAEALVRILVALWDGQAVREYGSARAYLDAQRAPRTRSRADELDAETVARVCSRLDVARRRWEQLAPGEKLELVWQPPRG